jgi:ferredoxin-type protein NapH
VGVRELIESVSVLLGRDPHKPTPEEISPEAKEIHERKAVKRDREAALTIKDLRDQQLAMPEKWRRRRWVVLLAINLMFVVSYRLDIQLVEGALTASRFMGFHMADLNSALQVMLASRMVLINLVIGASLVFLLCLLGGRIFCSWICPYHLLAEWAELVHVKLAKKKWVRDHQFDRRTRVWLWVIFTALAFVSGYTVFEWISPTGIVSRALIYGPGLILLWVGVLLLFEVLYSRRAWCRYACPIGLTYGFVGALVPIRVTYDLLECHHDGNCRTVCEVPHVLDMTRKKRARDVRMDVGADCTRCGRCIDACPSNSLNFSIKKIGRLS